MARLRLAGIVTQCSDIEDFCLTGRALSAARAEALARGLTLVFPQGGEPLLLGKTLHQPQQLWNKQRDRRDINNHHQRDQQGGVERQQRFDELLNFHS